jgi:nitrogenase molybdenum-iron protein beta chain
MAKILDEPRYVCALGGSQTVQAIHRAVPVFHSGSGCARRVSGDGSGTGYLAANTFPCSNIGEAEVVFGGESKLRDVIANALKVIDGDLFVVLSGCTTEIIGDNLEQVVSEFQDAGKPVISVSAPGFKGTNYEGHEWVIDAIARQYLTRLPKGGKIKGLVNIWGPVPSHDPYWLGDLRELENLIRELGLTPNIIFGEHRGIDNLNRVPLAEFNLLVSSWVGLNSVRLLEELFGTPCLHYPTLPTSAHESSAFLRAVAEFAHINPKLVEPVIAKHEEEYYYYIERAVSVFFETPNRFQDVFDGNDCGTGACRVEVPHQRFRTDAQQTVHHRKCPAGTSRTHCRILQGLQLRHRSGSRLFDRRVSYPPANRGGILCGTAVDCRQSF